MQCVCGFAVAFGCRRPAKSHSVQTNKFIRTIGRFCRYYYLKNYTAAANKASLEQSWRCLRKGKFFRRQKFALLSQATQL
jgi:hypothetical protein